MTASELRPIGSDLIGWSLECDDPLHKGGRWSELAIDRFGDTLTVLDVLAQQVGIYGRLMRVAWG